MLQQINLYKLLPVKARFELTKSIALTIYGILLFLLLSIYGVELEAKHLANVKYTLLNNQVNVFQQRLALLTQEYPMSDASSIAKKLDELTQQLSVKNQMLNLVTAQNDFSSYLIGLATVNMQDAWYTEIKVNNMNQTMELKGFALESAQVDQLLVKLANEPIFSGLKFELKNITESPEPPSFEISAKAKVLL